MLKLCAVVLLCLSLTAHAHAKPHAYSNGKVVSVSIDTHLVEGTAVEYAIYKVQIGDLLYTVRGDRVSRKAEDYTRGLIIGDAAQVSVEGGEVWIKLPNGKDMKTGILKRERVDQ